MIKGIHHISMKCCGKEQLQKVREFYCDMLELPLYSEWDGGIMIETPAGKIEVLINGTEDRPQGVIRHFAFEVDDFEIYLEKCRKNGIEIFFGPKEVTLGTHVNRVAFCHGPLGEDVEFFQAIK